MGHLWTTTIEPIATFLLACLLAIGAGFWLVIVPLAFWKAMAGFIRRLGRHASGATEAVSETQQPVWEDAVCCMLVSAVGEDSEDGKDIGAIGDAICGAVATEQWHVVENGPGGHVTVALPLCPAHLEAFRAAVTLADGSTTRDVMPVGALAGVQAEMQDIVDTLLATVKTHLYDDLHASEAQVEHIWEACDVALTTRATQPSSSASIMRPDASPAKPIKPKAHGRIQRKANVGDSGGKRIATQPMRLV